MFLSYTTLLVALSLSIIAAYYSIAGLTAIFAAAVVPIIVMGSILELGKVVVTLWLHEYWRQCRLLMKMYLVPAVALLMLITSMGIFGFLSKAHSDQSLVSGDVQSKIAIYDEKIKTARENIESNRKQLKQMDEAVDQVMGRSTTESGADKANNIRRSQQRDRAAIAREIETNQKLIAKLNDEAAPIRAEVRKVEAEVGPIKYIAALVYGDNPDANLLEAAVRWVIILLVIVFDPLAIMMLLAASESLKWEKQQRFDLRKISKPTSTDQTPEYEPDDGELTSDQLQQIKQSAETQLPEKSILEQHPYLNAGFVHFENLEPMVVKPESSITVQEEKQSVTVPVVDNSTEEIYDDEHPSIKAAIARWKTLNPNDTLKNQRARLARGEITELPWLQFMEHMPPPVGNSGFGDQFPVDPNKGDTFVKTDRLPNLVYKYNGTNWIEVDKNLTDSYTYNTAYIDHLIEQISRGEYDTELLSNSEREQVKQRLENQA